MKKIFRALRPDKKFKRKGSVLSVASSIESVEASTENAEDIGGGDNFVQVGKDLIGNRGSGIEDEIIGQSSNENIVKGKENPDDVSASTRKDNTAHFHSQPVKKLYTVDALSDSECKSWASSEPSQKSSKPDLTRFLENPTDHPEELPQNRCDTVDVEVETPTAPNVDVDFVAPFHADEEWSTASSAGMLPMEEVQVPAPEPEIGVPCILKNINSTKVVKPKSSLIRNSSLNANYGRIGRVANTVQSQSRRLSLNSIVDSNQNRDEIGGGGGDMIDDVLQKTEELLTRQRIETPVSTSCSDEQLLSVVVDGEFNLATSQSSIYENEIRPGTSNETIFSGQMGSEQSGDNGYFLSNNNGSYGKKGCCDPAPISRFQSTFSADSRMVPYQGGNNTRYCDSIPPGMNDPRVVIVDILKDLQCVVDKTLGDNTQITNRYQTVQVDYDGIKDDLDDCENCRNELEREVIKLRAEVQAAQFAFDGEVERRIALEGFVAQLKAQLFRLQAICDADAQEKNQLANCLREAELKVRELTDAVQYLELERDQLLRNCRGFEEWKDRETETFTVSQGRCDLLEEALAKCCQANEDLQAEIRKLKQEINNHVCIEKQLQLEKNQILEELKRERMCWAAEKERFEQTICELRKAYDLLTAQNQEICQKMNEVVSLHHSEMDCLRKEAEKFKAFFECEKTQRERLEKALRDCEERKSQMMRQLVHQPQVKSYDPCTDGGTKYKDERSENQHTQKYEKELTQLREQSNNLKLEMQTEREKALRDHEEVRTQMFMQQANHTKKFDQYRDEREVLSLKQEEEVDQLRKQNNHLKLKIKAEREKALRDREELQGQILNQAHQSQTLEKNSDKNSDHGQKQDAELNLLREQNNNLKLEIITEREKAVRESEELKGQMLIQQAYQNSTVQKYRDERSEFSQKEETELNQLREQCNQLQLEIKAEREKARKDCEQLKAEMLMQQEHQSKTIDKYSDARSEYSKKQEAELAQLRGECNNLKLEIKAEREYVFKLKYKGEVQREQLRTARDQIQDMEKDSKSQKLMIQIDQIKADHEKLLANAKNQNEELVAQVYRLQSETARLQQALQIQLKSDEITNEAIQELRARKDKLEREICDLRKSINERYVERDEVDRWKATYDASITSLESRYEAAFKRQLNAKIAEVSSQLQRQSRDRSLIEEMRDANENTLRSEYGQVTTSLKSDVDNLKRLVQAREEEIITLKSSMTRLKQKYTSEATVKENLLKQVQILASQSHTSLINNNNTIDNNNT